MAAWQTREKDLSSSLCRSSDRTGAEVAVRCMLVASGIETLQPARGDFVTACEFRRHRWNAVLVVMTVALFASGCDFSGTTEAAQLIPAHSNRANSSEHRNSADVAKNDESVSADAVEEGALESADTADKQADASAASDGTADSEAGVVEPTADAGVSSDGNDHRLYGPRQQYAPAYDVDVPVGRLTQSLIDAHGPGTKFRLAAGTHRLSWALKPKQYQQFLGAPGAIVNGARVLRNWTPTGSLWYVSGQTQRLPKIPVGGVISDCRSGYPRCAHGENVFLDGRLLRHVGSLDQVGPGKYFFDYTRDRIYIGDDPSGHIVEATVAPQALASNAPGVTVRNLVIEMFGHGDAAAVHSDSSPGWSLINSEVRLNHGIGAKIGSGLVTGNYVHHNENFGLAGSGNGNRVIGNEIAYNNTTGFAGGGGGSKWVHNDGLIVRDNWSHHNGGPGLWTDINNINTVYENNEITDNALAGIMHEVSYSAAIRSNTIRRNGFDLGSKWWVAGAGIYVINSPDVEVSGNMITDNRSGVMGRHDSPRASNQGGTHGATELRNFSVHDNTIRMPVGATGIVGDSAETFSSAGNRFRANDYVVNDTSGRFWEWNRDWGREAVGRTWSEWNAFGNDRDGSLN